MYGVDSLTILNDGIQAIGIVATVTTTPCGFSRVIEIRCYSGRDRGNMTSTTKHSGDPLPSYKRQPVEEIISSAGTTLSVPYWTKLASRLTELQKAVQEEELDGGGITVSSLQHFLELLQAYPALRCPAVSATPERNIYASWKSGSNRVFSIHFLPDGKVRFVIFCPNDKHPDQTIRLSGTATVDVIISVAAPHGVLNWAAE